MATDSDFYQTFSTESGRAVIKYLKQITIDTVHGPLITTEELRHLEGQRFIVNRILTKSKIKEQENG